jgi:serine phosphatase RsbU (regulator of sigma subunit)
MYNKSYLQKASFILILILSFVSDQFYAQNPIMVDSLEKVLQTNMPDTQRAKVFRKLAWEYGNLANLKVAYKNAQTALNLSIKINDYYGINRAYLVLATLYLVDGKYATALESYNNSLKFLLKSPIEDKKKNIELSFLNMRFADVYVMLENYEKSLYYTDKAIELAKQESDTTAKLNLMLYKTRVFRNFKKYNEGLALANKILVEVNKIYSGEKRDGVKAEILDLIFELKLQKKDFKEAEKTLLKARLLARKNANKRALSTIYYRQAQLAIELKHPNLAYSYIDSAIAINTDNFRLMAQYEMQGDILCQLNRNNEAKISYEKWLKLTQEGKISTNEIQALKKLASIYKKLNEPKLGLEATERYIKIDDSLNNNKTQNTIADLQAASEREIKQKEIDVLNKDKKLQTTIRNSFVGGFALMFLLAGVSYRNFRRKKKDNQIITKQKTEVEKQKHLVEEKNREITDSIEYALRIQTAILPPQKIIKQYLENSFILYKPKDIVAGDFYWIETVNDLVLFAACDCTGHGVPGAMVSVVCHNALNRAVREFSLTQPAAILDKTTEIVLENFSKSEEEIQDGMDISICALNTKTRLLEWAGANNPLWLIVNGILIETKADKQCIGHNDNPKPFTNHKLKLESDTNIYLFSDGFADQFGGKPERKLTKNSFKELLLSIQHLPIQQHATELDNFITKYKQDIEQTDDILVIGVRV